MDRKNKGSKFTEKIQTIFKNENELISLTPKVIAKLTE